jgi:hypothetical protein
VIRVLTAIAALVAVILAAPIAGAESRVVFPYRDADFLSPGEVGGGIVVVPDPVMRGRARRSSFSSTA